MGKINRNWPEVIDINKKYHHQIGCRMLVLRETKNILVDKENYNKWFNSMNNSPVKSPNYNKMNFLLEKLKEKKLLEEVPFRHTADPKTQSPILKPRMTLYKSKHRSIKLKKKWIIIFLSLLLIWFHKILEKIKLFFKELIMYNRYIHQH